MVHIPSQKIGLNAGVCQPLFMNNPESFNSDDFNELLIDRRDKIISGKALRTFVVSATIERVMPGTEIRKKVFRMGIALLAFAVGVIAVGKFGFREPSDVAILNRQCGQGAELKVTEWRLVRVGRVSIWIPESLKRTWPAYFGMGSNVAMRGTVSSDTNFYLDYSYGSVVPGDYNPPSTLGSDVLINGRPAKLWVHYPSNNYEPTGLYSPSIELRIPDIGDGKTKFEIQIESWQLCVAKQMIDSIEIH